MCIYIYIYIYTYTYVSEVTPRQVDELCGARPAGTRRVPRRPSCCASPSINSSNRKSDNSNNSYSINNINNSTDMVIIVLI